MAVLCRTACLLLFLIGSTRFGTADDRWPEWRGAAGQGHADATHLPVSWSETENIAWKVDIPGRGWSTPVVENGQVWVTTALDRLAPEEEAARRRKTSTNSEPLRISEFVSLRAVCVDLNTGKILHDVEVLNEQDPQMIHVDNTYATPSPILENGRLYCHYGPCGMACLDVAQQKVLWENRTLKVLHENGPGSSPVLWGDLLIVHCDGIDVQYIIALDKHTGKQVWKTPRSGKLHDNPQMRKSYATPLVCDVNGRPQVVSPAADWMYGYDPQTGRELWKIDYGQLGFSNAARPVAGHGLLYVSTGFPRGEMLAVKVEDQGGTPVPSVAWRGQKQAPRVSCALLVGDELYFASDNGIATCVDAHSGEIHWTERIGKKFWASPLYADGKIYFLGREATTTVIKPGTTFEQLAVNQLDGEMLAGAAAIDGALILRTDKSLYAIRP